MCQRQSLEICHLNYYYINNINYSLQIQKILKHLIKYLNLEYYQYLFGSIFYQSLIFVVLLISDISIRLRAFSSAMKQVSDIAFDSYIIFCPADIPKFV